MRSNEKSIMFFRSLDRGVSKQLLYGSEFGSRFKESTGKSISKAVRMNVVDSCQCSQHPERSSQGTFSCFWVGFPIPKIVFRVNNWQSIQGSNYHFRELYTNLNPCLLHAQKEILSFPVKSLPGENHNIRNTKARIEQDKHQSTSSSFGEINFQLVIIVDFIYRRKKSRNFLSLKWEGRNSFFSGFFQFGGRVFINPFSFLAPVEEKSDVFDLCSCSGRGYLTSSSPSSQSFNADIRKLAIFWQLGNVCVNCSGIFGSCSLRGPTSTQISNIKLECCTDSRGNCCCFGTSFQLLDSAEGYTPVLGFNGFPETFARKFSVHPNWTVAAGEINTFTFMNTGSEVTSIEFQWALHTE